MTGLARNGWTALSLVFAFNIMAHSTPATAQSSEEIATVPTEHVRFADLDLSSTVGQASLRRRIQIAVGDVCFGRGAMEDFVVGAQCYRISFGDGMRQMKQVIARNRTGPRLAASGPIIITGE